MDKWLLLQKKWDMRDSMHLHHNIPRNSRTCIKCGGDLIQMIFSRDFVSQICNGVDQ